MTRSMEQGAESRVKGQRIARGFAVLAALGSLAGCRQDMHNQPKFVPQRGTTFFADGRSARPQVENTVARGQLRESAYFYTGLVGDHEGDGMPFPVTMEVLEKGQERYNIYCTPCHSRVGNGVGMIVQRGYAKAGNFHTARLQAAPLGHFFNVITNGYGAMPEYSAQVTVADRWAITAYIRALQLSQNATQAEVASGAHVEPLASISEEEGFSRTFADEWALPPTAVTGTPTDQPYVLPGVGAATMPGPGAGSNAGPRTLVPFPSGQPRSDRTAPPPPNTSSNNQPQ